MKNGCIVLLVVLFVLFLLCGCRSVKYVPVETVVTDTTYINKLVRDSIYQRDCALSGGEGVDEMGAVPLGRGRLCHLHGDNGCADCGGVVNL